VSEQSNEILITILGGSAILLFFALTLIFLIIVYRKKQKEYWRQREKLQENFRKELLQAQLEAQEQTFRTLSQELHDNIGQVLSLAKLNVSVLEMNNQGVPDEHVTQTKTLLNTAINDLRDISKTLNTDYVKEKDLAESIERELGMLRRTRKFEAKFELQGTAFHISPERRLILFRIVQESLNNIVKHAAATSINVTLNYNADELLIAISDNGNGFDQQTTAKGLGLLNMESRSQLIQSKIEVMSVPDVGTKVMIRVEKQTNPPN
jgi:signal transduction histidine kinase